MRRIGYLLITAVHISLSLRRKSEQQVGYELGVPRFLSRQNKEIFAPAKRPDVPIERPMQYLLQDEAIGQTFTFD